MDGSETGSGKLSCLWRNLVTKSTMRGLVVIWTLTLFTYAFVIDHTDEQYRGTLIGLVSLAVGYYIGKHTKED
jgi:hypothetical protein